MRNEALTTSLTKCVGDTVQACRYSIGQIITDILLDGVAVHGEYTNCANQEPNSHDTKERAVINHLNPTLTDPTTRGVIAALTFGITAPCECEAPHQTKNGENSSHNIPPWN